MGGIYFPDKFLLKNAKHLLKNLVQQWLIHNKYNIPFKSSLTN